MTTKPKDSASLWVDPDDAPLLMDEFFEQGTWRVGEEEVTPQEAKAVVAKIKPWEPPQREQARPL